MRTRRWGEKALLVNCVVGIQAIRERCATTVESSTALVTALAEEIGYERAADIAQQATQARRSIREIVTSSGLMNAEQFDQMISPARVTRLGYPNRKRE